MSRTVLRHRRAERFAQLLDEADGGRRHHLRSSFDRELTDLVEVRHRIVRAAPPVRPDPEFRGGLRALLIATAERDGIGATARATTTGDRRRRRLSRGLAGRGPRARAAVVAGIAAGAVAFAGISHASENALPGDALYSLKRSTERAHLALAGSDLNRGELYLDFARTRLTEAATMTGAIRATLDDMDEATRSGVSLLTGTAVAQRDSTALDLIDGFAATQRDLLDRLGGERRGTERDRIAASVALLDDVVDRSSRLRSSLACEVTSAVQVDLLGPLLADCPTSAPPPTLVRPPRGSAPAQQSPAGTDPGPDHPGTSSRPSADAGPTPTGPAPSTSTSPTGQPSGSPAPSTSPAEEPDDGDDGGGGLLDGLNRLLDGLFGG